MCSRLEETTIKRYARRSTHRRRRTWLKATAVAAGVFALAFGVAFAMTVVFSQPFAGTGSSAASQNAPDSAYIPPKFAQAWDNFTLPVDTTITDVTWAGGFFQAGTNQSISSFDIGIYSNNNGVPGALVWATNVVGNAGQTLLGTFGSFEAYAYGVTGRDAKLGKGTYWLSVVPTTPGQAFVQWGWSQGLAGSGGDYLCFLGSCTTNGAPSELAFTLATSLPATVGAPASLGLAALGAALAALSRRRARAPRAA